jgi:uncharacterized membrane protein
MKKWILPLAIWLAAVGVSIYGLFTLPDVIVTHFGLDDEPNGWMRKELGLSLTPLMMLLVIGMIMVTPRFEKDASKRQRLEQNISVIAAAFASSLLVLHVLLVSYNLGVDVPFDRILPVFVGIIFAAIGNITPRLPQSSANLVILPEPAYRRMTRQLGRVMAIAGILIALTAVLPPPWNPAATIGTVIASVIVGTGLSFYHMNKAA